MDIHHSITLERVIEAVERAQLTLDDPGFCIFCGSEADGVEPDAQKYCCESCVQNGVYGAEELAFLLM